MLEIECKTHKNAFTAVKSPQIKNHCGRGVYIPEWPFNIKRGSKSFSWWSVKLYSKLSAVARRRKTKIGSQRAFVFFGKLQVLPQSWMRRVSGGINIIINIINSYLIVPSVALSIDASKSGVGNIFFQRATLTQKSKWRATHTHSTV